MNSLQHCEEYGVEKPEQQQSLRLILLISYLTFYTLRPFLSYYKS